MEHHPRCPFASRGGHVTNRVSRNASHAAVSGPAYAPPRLLRPALAATARIWMRPGACRYVRRRSVRPTVAHQMLRSLSGRLAGRWHPGGCRSARTRDERQARGPIPQESPGRLHPAPSTDRCPVLQLRGDCARYDMRAAARAPPPAAWGWSAGARSAGDGHHREPLARGDRARRRPHECPGARITRGRLRAGRADSRVGGCRPPNDRLAAGGHRAQPAAPMVDPRQRGAWNVRLLLTGLGLRELTRIPTFPRLEYGSPRASSPRSLLSSPTRHPRPATRQSCGPTVVARRGPSSAHARGPCGRRCHGATASGRSARGSR